MAEFELHPQLLADTHWIGDLPLCRVLLMNNSNFPWLVLVPRRVGLRELFELSDADQLQWLAECNLISRVLVAELAAEKLNIAALGNMVPQLTSIVWRASKAIWHGRLQSGGRHLQWPILMKR